MLAIHNGIIKIKISEKELLTSELCGEHITPQRYEYYDIIEGYEIKRTGYTPEKIKLCENLYECANTHTIRCGKHSEVIMTFNDLYENKKKCKKCSKCLIIIKEGKC